MSLVQVTLRRSIDQFTATSIGTGTAKTQLNGGNNLNTPDSVRAILGITPVIEPQTITAGQTEAVQFDIDSPMVPLKPKQVLATGVIGGLGTFPFATHPVLREIPTFTKLATTGVKQIQAFGTALQANTSAPLCAVEVDYSLDDINPALLERFYQTPASGNTATGTAAATVTGNTIQISTGKQSVLPNGIAFGGFLEFIQALLIPNVITASNSLVGFMTFSSNDLMTPEPITLRIHPIASALGTAIGVATIQQNIRENIHRPIKASSLIATSATFDVAPTAAGIFEGGIGYTQPP